MRRKLSVAAAMIILVAAAGLPTIAAEPAPRPRIEIADAWVRPPNKLATEADAFFTIVNHTDRVERLVGVISPGGEACLCQMHPGLKPYVEKLPFIEIKAHGSVTLRPGYSYIVLKDAGEEVRPGRSVNLTLHFLKSGTREITAPVTNQLLGNLGRSKPKG